MVGGKRDYFSEWIGDDKEKKMELEYVQERDKDKGSDSVEKKTVVAGREFDTVVGNLVLGLKGWDLFSEFLPKFSERLDDSYKVIKVMENNGFRVHMNQASEGSRGVREGTAVEGDWHCNFVKELPDRKIINYVYHKELPMAICLAALKAIGHEVIKA